MIGDEIVRKGTAWHNKKEAKKPYKAQKRTAQPKKKKKIVS